MSSKPKKTQWCLGSGTRFQLIQGNLKLAGGQYTALCGWCGGRVRLTSDGMLAMHRVPSNPHTPARYPEDA
jgi:hypothetical protein